jgi:uncharacterized membrane protein YozB (DUF420 family)
LQSLLHYLPTVNATLNGTATLLLIAGYRLIKAKRETAHKRTMLAAFAVSIVFLVCYLTYHAGLHYQTGQGHVTFHGPPAVRTVYLTILVSHVILAAIVPVLAGVTIYLGYRDRRARHRRWAKWTFPIWLYVSITGVVIYLMLYHLYPAPIAAVTMVETAKQDCRGLSQICAVRGANWDCPLLRGSIVLTSTPFATIPGLIA